MHQNKLEFRLVLLSALFLSCHALLPDLLPVSRRTGRCTDSPTARQLQLQLQRQRPLSLLPPQTHIQRICQQYRNDSSSNNNNDNNNSNNKPHFRLRSSPHHWQGDDIRWSTRLSRRFFQHNNYFNNLWHRHTGRNLLFLLNCAAFTYQVITTVHAIRRRHASYWPSQAWSIVADAVWGSTSVTGSFTKANIHSTILSRRQPHRYLTSGFLHGGLLHLVFNMHALLRSLPSWLETGLGTPLYMTAYLLSIVMGNAAHSWLDHSGSNSMCLGASGGITGLYGLMFVCLVRMGSRSAASQVLKGMLLLFLYGIVLESISNAAHIGGFVGGLLVGVLCGPSYGKSYSMRRKWSLEVDDAPRDYRLAMGFGTKPSTGGLIPLPVLWLGILLGILSQPKWRNAPKLILQGILRPSSVGSGIFGF